MPNTMGDFRVTLSTDADVKAIAEAFNVLLDRLYALGYQLNLRELEVCKTAQKALEDALIVRVVGGDE